MEVKGDHVKIGVQAPKSIPVYRKEVFEQIQKENEEAMKAESMKDLKDLF